MLIIYKDNEGRYYDSELKYLGGAKAAYDYVVQVFQTAGVRLEEKCSENRKDYYDYMHEEVLCWETVTGLNLAVTGESLCQYVTMLERTTWNGDHESASFSGNPKYIAVKSKSEWKAPAPVKMKTKEPEKVIVFLDQTLQALKTKYHLEEIGAQKEMWRIRGGSELLDTKLYLGQDALGTLREVSMMPNGMILLRNHLKKVTGKGFECQCRSEIGMSKEGNEYYRQVVCLAEEGKLEKDSLSSMAGSSMICVSYARNLSTGREIVNLFWKKLCEDLELHIYK